MDPAITALIEENGVVLRPNLVEKMRTTELRQEMNYLIFDCRFYKAHLSIGNPLTPDFVTFHPSTGKGINDILEESVEPDSNTIVMDGRTFVQLWALNNSEKYTLTSKIAAIRQGVPVACISLRDFRAREWLEGVGPPYQNQWVIAYSWDKIVGLTTKGPKIASMGEWEIFLMMQIHNYANEFKYHVREHSRGTECAMQTIIKLYEDGQLYPGNWEIQYRDAKENRRLYPVEINDP